MAKQGCIRIELDESNYSSPMPMIGLYIAVASLLCSLAMLHDIFSGLRHSKQWLPCRWFSLNSLTLTLLSIAAKIPLDLTTSMPGALDQVSKLSGTLLVCASMGFFMPSLGINKSSECLQNMAALTILVLTIIGNVCIQISTGVIFMFISQHIMIMCCMVFLLLALWVTALDINKKKEMCIDRNKDLLKKSEGSMLQRLKLAYLYGYNSNPQFILCRQPTVSFVSELCFFCVFFTVDVLLRFLSSCGGYSAYDWSMVMIVATQVLTLIIGVSACIFRSWFTVIKNLLFIFNPIGKVNDEIRTMINSNPLLVSDYFGKVVDLLTICQPFYFACAGLLASYGSSLSSKITGPSLYKIIIIIGLTIITSSLLFMIEDPKPRLNTEHQGNGDTLEYTHLIEEGDRESQRWLLGKSLTDMNKWMETSKSKCGNHLSDLLLTTPPSEPFPPMELDVSSLSMVLLVRIAAVVIPSTLSGALVQAYNEADETVRYVDEKIISLVGENRSKSRLARAVRAGYDFGRQEIFKMTNPTQSDLDRALEIILRLKNTLPSDIVWKEVGAISSFILRREYTSIGELYSYMKQMFVTMLHTYLSQLPNAIFKDLTESPAEEFDVRTKVALKLVCRLDRVEDQIQWSFPEQCNISSLITAQDPSTQSVAQDPSAQSPLRDHSTQSQGDPAVENNAASSDNFPSEENVANNAPATVADVIVQIDPSAQSPLRHHSTQSQSDPTVDNNAASGDEFLAEENVANNVPATVADVIVQIDPSGQSPLRDHSTQSQGDPVVENNVASGDNFLAEENVANNVPATVADVIVQIDASTQSPFRDHSTQSQGDPAVENNVASSDNFLAEENVANNVPATVADVIVHIDNM